MDNHREDKYIGIPGGKIVKLDMLRYVILVMGASLAYLNLVLAIVHLIASH